MTKKQIANFLYTIHIKMKGIIDFILKNIKNILFLTRCYFNHNICL